jgi:hypothetical protein
MAGAIIGAFSLQFFSNWDPTAEQDFIKAAHHPKSSRLPQLN